MSDTYNRPSTWPDGVTPPAIVISNPRAIPPLSVTVLMPNPIKGFDPEFNEAVVKRSKYGGRIHKSLKGDLWDAEFQWVLTADEPVLVLGASGSPVITDTFKNYIDVIQAIVDIDAVFDITPYCVLQIRPHGDDGRGDSDDADHFAHGYVNFRLENRKDIISALKGKTVVKLVKMKISTDGYINSPSNPSSKMPFNTIHPPTSYR